MSTSTTWWNSLDFRDTEHLLPETLPDLVWCLKETGPLLLLQLQEQHFDSSSLYTAETW